MRGNVRVGSVLKFIRQLPFVTKEFNVEMVTMHAHLYLPRSAVGAVLVHVSGSFNHKLGDEFIQYKDNAVMVAPVEVRTNLSPNTVRLATGIMRSKPDFCNHRDKVTRKLFHATMQCNYCSRSRCSPRCLPMPWHLKQVCFKQCPF